jgi:hypothetical protein
MLLAEVVYMPWIFEWIFLNKHFLIPQSGCWIKQRKFPHKNKHKCSRIKIWIFWERCVEFFKTKKLYFIVAFII